MTEEIASPDDNRSSTRSSTTSIEANFRYDPAYIRTLPGILKCIQIFLNFCCFISSALTIKSSALGGLCSFISGSGFWFSAILLALTVFHIAENFNLISFLKFEFVFCASWALLYLLTIILIILSGSIIVSFFCFGTMGAYGYDSYIKYYDILRKQKQKNEQNDSRRISIVVDSTDGYEMS